ncbi:hypothetical protein ACFE04_007733 [Oxalis oulophora]
MAFVKIVFTLLVLVVSLCEVSLADVYNVGDSANWTAGSGTDYNKWSQSKSFHVGDTIVFTYNKEHHNVLQVTHNDYSACNPNSPRHTYTSGSDSITFKRHGRYFYICGIPGHCEQGGQKFSIFVNATRPTSWPAPTVSPVPTPSPAPSHMVSAPSPTKSSVGSVYPSMLLLSLVVFFMLGSLLG